MGHQGHYFAAGPAALPAQVKQQIQDDILHYQDTSISILELGHRSEAFTNILDQARLAMRTLYAIPENYQILFVQGGATLHFDAVPLNLLGARTCATYIDTGLWSAKAARCAQKYMRVESFNGTHTQAGRHGCLDPSEWVIHPDSAYVHFTPNETVDGIDCPDPTSSPVPVVADMTSCLLMREFNVADFGLIYSGAQKTLGIAGLSVVIVRDDLLDRAHPSTPELCRYDVHAQHQSIVNTSPVFACYVMQLMLQWVSEQGGVSAMVAASRERAKIIYEAIDANACWSNTIAPEHRSIINAVFQGQSQAHVDKLLAQAESCGLTGLQGHRKVGGVRVSMYNGTPLCAVEKLADMISSIKL